MGPEDYDTPCGMLGNAMTEVEQMATERLRLRTILEGILMANVVGMNADGRLALEIQRIETMRALNEVAIY